uniref:translin-associated factor X-interacting protein 1-like n=1 Tax=Styela clava TaxID=7725 RepID=UPI00193ACC95|nr:translin-associated factor X-interacting protein 1-like [Styela clava]
MSLKPVRLPPIEPEAGTTLHRDQGPSYKLSGVSSRHQLPPQSVLRPGIDTQSGELDSWPAYASRSITDIGAIGRGGKGPKKQSVIPKPKFLEALENYVEREIITLNCQDPKPSELRLQAYREVFEYLIGDFKTYRPLLSQIKNEYEKMLSHYREKIRELEPLKSMLITVSEQCDQKILRIREEENHEILGLRRKVKELLNELGQGRIREQGLQAQILKLQEEMAKEYKRYRDECDMRKLLISDMNDLRHQYEDMKRMAGQGAMDDEDDPVRLKIALKVARENLGTQAAELNRIKADYGDVIPRRDFLALETNFTEMNEKYETFQQDFSKLKSEHDTLLDVHQQVIDQRDEYYTEAETLRRSATPRPQWKKCAEIVPGGQERWYDLYHGKRSAEILDSLVSELKAGHDKGPETFEGEGLGEEVPKYLQFEGTIRNRMLSKAEVANLLKLIWSSKTESDRLKGARQDMKEFLLDYFRQKYNDPEMVAEWGYSLKQALINFENEPHVKLFANVLNGKGSEDIYYREMDVIKTLMVSLDELDNEKAGSLNIDQFGAAIKKAFPLKMDPEIEALVSAAQAELEMVSDTTTTIVYRALFTEDEEGNTGPFLTLLRQQERDERDAYVDEIFKQLEGKDEVPMQEMKETLMMLDPQITSPIMQKYLSIAYSCTPELTEQAEPAALDTVIDRMKKGGIYRVGTPL